MVTTSIDLMVLTQVFPVFVDKTGHGILGPPGLIFTWMLGVIQVVWSGRPDASLAASMSSTLRFLVALVGRVVWFLTVNVAPVLGIYVALAFPVVKILASNVHLGIGDWGDIQQVPVCGDLESRPELVIPKTDTWFREYCDSDWTESIHHARKGSGPRVFDS